MCTQEQATSLKRWTWFAKIWEELPQLAMKPIAVTTMANKMTARTTGPAISFCSGSEWW